MFHKNTERRKILPRKTENTQENPKVVITTQQSEGIKMYTSKAKVTKTHGRWLRRDVVGYPIDPCDLIGNARRNASQNFGWEGKPNNLIRIYQVAS